MVYSLRRVRAHTIENEELTMEQNKKAEHFGSRIGFILAAAGSAVGLGNIWRFPYLAAKYGGGIFIFCYILLALTFGFTLMLTEIAIGRKTQKSAIGAYRAVDRRFSFLGILASLVPVIIAPYYCVIGGWVLKYFTAFAVGSGAALADDGSAFSGFISDPGTSTVFFVVYVLINALVVLLGVQKGIEKISKLLMPLLVVLTVGIAVYTMTLPGAFEGVKYYLLPDFKGMTLGKFLKVLVAAMGQLFYSLSIAMGIMITYGSYVRREESLEKSVRQISLFDTAIALMAGLIIVPSVFIFAGGDPAALNAGPSLMFITLPNVFAGMRGGQIIGAVFFLLVTLAALTSSISLMETVVDIVSELFHVKRRLSTLITLATILGLGMLSILGYSVWSDFTVLGMQILDFFDYISNNVMMPAVALLTCILVGYVVKTKYVEDEVLACQPKFGALWLYRIMIWVFCPACMIAILATNFFITL